MFRFIAQSTSSNSPMLTLYLSPAIIRYHNNNNVVTLNNESDYWANRLLSDYWVTDYQTNGLMDGLTG